MIYFKLAGFDLDDWYGRYLRSGTTFPRGSITAWEAYQLVFNDSYANRHSAERFITSAGTSMTYDEFRAYAINSLENDARQEKANSPNWRTQLTSTHAIRTLMGLFDYTADQIAAL